MSAYSDRTHRLAADLIEILNDHDQRQHNGERCYTETINVLAYLAHRVGLDIDGKVTDGSVRELLERIRDYGAIHREHHA